MFVKFFRGTLEPIMASPFSSQSPISNVNLRLIWHFSYLIWPAQIFCYHYCLFNYKIVGLCRGTRWPRGQSSVSHGLLPNYFLVALNFMIYMVFVLCRHRAQLGVSLFIFKAHKRNSCWLSFRSASIIAIFIS